MRADRRAFLPQPPAIFSHSAACQAPRPPTSSAPRVRPTRLFSHLLASIVAVLFGTASSPASPVELYISVPDQSLAVLREGEVLGKFRISTSKFGLGDNYGSYRTPLGDFRICDKVGGGLPLGSVLSGRHATGEVLVPNAKGRDPIVTRILWLEGQEAANQNARARGIYIHGTAEERNIGKPVSYGCIRMRSADVVKVYELTPVGSTVRIETRKISAMTKPRLQERAVQLAAQKEAAKAGLLAANTPPPVASGPAPAPATRERPTTSEPEKNVSVLSKLSSKLMSGSILDYDVYERGDTIPVRGGEVQWPSSMDTFPGPPVEKKLASARSR